MFWSPVFCGAYLPAFLQFLTDYIEILSISFFFEAVWTVQSDLKNVYETQIHDCTQNYSSLAWKTKKLENRYKMRAVQ